MSVKSLPINEVVAQNLAYWMGRANIKQAALAEKARVSQKTVSNYLNPGQRSEGALGKAPSPKLVELDAIATALGVEVWQLTRQMTHAERAMYESIEKAYGELRASLSASIDADQRNALTPEAPRNGAYPEGADKAAGPGLAVVPSAQKKWASEHFPREPTQEEDRAKYGSSRDSGVRKTKNVRRAR